LTAQQQLGQLSLAAGMTWLASTPGAGQYATKEAQAQWKGEHKVTDNESNERRRDFGNNIE
jgi:hypothetical protein